MGRPSAVSYHDRGATFEADFRCAVETFGLTVVRTAPRSAPRSPWQNPHVERLIGSIGRECLDRAIVLSQRTPARVAHLRQVLPALTDASRAGDDEPDGRPVDTIGAGRIVAVPEVGGPHHRYERRAA